jgi:hypothetical protein
MSTVPGEDALRDAGLVAPELDGAVNLAEEMRDAHDDADPEAYQPPNPRPDKEDLADEADVIDQARAVPDDEQH